MRKNKNLSTSIIFPIGCVAWAFLYYKFLFLRGSLISLDDAQAHLGRILFQHIAVNLPAWLLLVWGVKTKDKKEFFFCVPGRISGKIILGAASAAYLALLAYGLWLNSKPVQVLYAFVFYLLLVSFVEEYIYRGWLPAMLKGNASEWAVWIVPNALFALSHFVMIFVDDEGMKGMAVSTMLFFLVHTVFFGMVMEFAKRRLGSLWIAVLFHAIYDFCGEMMLWAQ